MATYYTLEEAADKLGLTTDAFRRKLATEWKTTPRRYPDGATLRFQVREIDELARSLGRGSSAEVQAADAPLSLADSSEDFVPLAPDSSVSLGGSKSGRLPKTAADSDVRLEATGGTVKPASSGKLKKGQGDKPTEEIHLDAERAQGPKSPVKGAAKYNVASDPDVQIKPPVGRVDSPSEFELSLSPDSSDEFDLKLSDDDSDEVEIGTMPRTGLKAGDSGINLQSPADSGISLEKSSSSEFELQLQGDESKKSKPKKPSTDKLPPVVASADSDSEFELTLDDSGEKPVGDATTAFDAEQKDIFETDFELPALDDESGSEAVALESDTDVESSDFDLAIDESDASAEEASESEVVALDEEEEAAPARRRRRAAEEDELDELEAAEDVDLEAEEDVRPSRAAAVTEAAPAEWGSLPAAVLLPCVLVMFLVGMMGFELLHSMWGYQQPYKPTGGLVRLIAETFGDKLPTD